MNQTWENGEKPSFGPDFHLFGPNLAPKIFSQSLTSTRSCTLSQVIIIFNFKGNLWSKLLKMVKNLQISVHQNFLLKLVVRHCFKLSSYAFKGKLMNQTCENGVKPKFGPKFAHLIYFLFIYLIHYLQSKKFYSSKNSKKIL